MNLSEVFIRRPVATSLIMLGLGLFGLFGLFGLMGARRPVSPSTPTRRQPSA
jgi:multidrug efflux pump subunit AcrB